MFQNLKNNSEPQRKIAFQTTDGLVFVAMEEIIRCESNMGYSYIYTKTQGKIISSKTIKEYEELLPENLFFRVHHSHIVNLTEISKYQRGRGGFIQMRDGTKIEVAARRKDDFLSRFNIS